MSRILPTAITPNNSWLNCIPATATVTVTVIPSEAAFESVSKALAGGKALTAIGMITGTFEVSVLQNMLSVHPQTQVVRDGVVRAL